MQRVEWLDTWLDSVLSHHWDTVQGIFPQTTAGCLGENAMATCTRLATDFLARPVPALATRILLEGKEACLLASHGSTMTAQALKIQLTTLVIQSKKSGPSGPSNTSKKNS